MKVRPLNTLNEYSLGFAFFQLLCEIFLIPEVCLHLFEVHATDGCEGILGDGGGHVCHSLLGGGSTDLGDVLGAVSSMTATVELALATLILRLLAVPDSVSVLAVVEALVASQRRGFVLLLLIVPG